MLAIYTPTYNRERQLLKLYDCLCGQKSKEFFWLIIDDGSNDRTEQIVKQWIDESRIDIRYIKKENGGKHTALNIALDIVDDYWNVCIDSDDWLLNAESVGRIVKDIENIKSDKNIVSIVYPYQFENLGIENISNIPKILNDCNPRNKNKNITEVTIISRPHAYKGIRFPIFKEENFISEGAIEIPKLFDGERMYIHNPLVEGRYLNDGLTNNIVKLWRKNPKGYFFVRNLQAKFYKVNKMYIKILQPLGQIVAYNIECNNNLLKGIEYKLWGIGSIPFGAIYWWKKFRKK